MTAERAAPIDFAVIGAQRAGSTYLSACLAEHPALYLPRDEVPYFEDPFFKATPASELERALSGATAPQHRGIHRPELLHRPECAARVAEANAEARVLAVLRSPVRRAISAHAWYVQFGLVPFEPVEQGLRRLLSGWSDDVWPRANEVLGFGFYAASLDRYIGALGADRVFVVRQEDLQATDTLRAAFRFLGVDASPSTTAVSPRSNEGVYAMPRLRWLRSRHRLGFNWDNEHSYTYRPRRLRQPFRSGVAAAVVGVDKLVLRPIFGHGGPVVSGALLGDLQSYYATELFELEQRFGWNLAAWRA